MSVRSAFRCAQATVALAVLTVASPLLAQQRPTVTHVIVDTDVGPDDMMAMAFLLGRPDVKIDAVVTETGLSHVDAGARNVLRLLHLAGADDIPVYAGRAVHLQPTVAFPASWVSQTEEELADAAPATSRQPATGDPVDVLARVLRAPAPHQEILALGPLTNLALAIRKAGAGNVKPIRTVIMGGAVDVPGNLVGPDTKTDNTRAEWNLFSDPLAASEVIASPLRVELIALDATRFVKMDTCFVDGLKGGGDTPRRRYVQRIMDFAREWIVRGDYYAWDPLAAVSLTDPSVVTLAPARLTVSLSGTFVGTTQRASTGHQVQLATHANRGRFMQVFDAALGRRRGAMPSGCRSPT